MIRFKAFFIFTSIFLPFSAGEPFILEESSEETLFGGNDTCKVLLQRFASTSAHFTNCTLWNARPIKICEECVHKYEDVVRSHDLILQVEDGSHNRKCKEQLMNLDRLQVIEEGFKYITDLWDRASCKYCFDSVNGSLKLSNSTIMFFNMSNDTQNCFLNHSMGDDTYNNSSCVDCEKFYCDMNQYYDSLKNAHEVVCMDIVDKMNVTRMMWNDKLKCRRAVPNTDVLYIACSCAIASLPILFYLGAKLCTTVMRSRLQIQKRLAEVLRPSTSSGVM